MAPADTSAHPPQTPETQTDHSSGSKADLTDEQVRAIADRVYAMLLRDLRQERERNRISIHALKALRGGR
jgi:hypothetical protein